MMSAMRIIDSHFHLGVGGFTVEKTIRYMDKNGIDACWLLTWEEVAPGLWPYHHLPVEDVVAAYERYPDRIVPLYAPDPQRTDAAETLQRWHSRGIRGCGELKSTLGWDTPGVQSLLDAANSLRMPVVFHMEEGGYREAPCSSSLFDRALILGKTTEHPALRLPQQLLRLLVERYQPLRDRKRSYVFPGYMLDFAALERALEAFPSVNFVAHGPMFWKYVSADAEPGRPKYPRGRVVGEGTSWRLLREHPNLHADISARGGFSALSRDRENARRFLTEMSAKVLYATDNVFRNQRKFIESLGLEKTALEAILGGNAWKIIQT